MAKFPKTAKLEVLQEAHHPRDPSTATFEEHAKALFRDRFGVELSDEVLREVVQNLTAYFDLLNEWDREENRETREVNQDE